MMRSSQTTVDVDDVADVTITVPKATELLMDLRRDKLPSWRTYRRSLVALLCVAAVGLVLWFQGATLTPGMIWVAAGLVMLSLFQTELDHQKTRQEDMVKLLAELVAQNNELQRQLQKVSRNS